MQTPTHDRPQRKLEKTGVYRSSFGLSRHRDAVEYFKNEHLSRGVTESPTFLDPGKPALTEFPRVQ